MSKLAGKVALVTGASKGIGAGIALDFAKAGAAVAVNYASDRAGAERVVKTITGNGGKAIAVGGDVSKAADVEHIFAETKAALGTIDILVNNAGIYRFGLLDAFTEAEFHSHFNINVLGPFLTMQQYARQAKPEGGSIINISTNGTVVKLPSTAIYTATKSALTVASEIFAKELGAKKIRVNVIAPGPTETEGVETLGGLKTEFALNLIAQIPLGRVGQPDDIAAVATFLASEDARWLTGEVIYASGGHH